MYTSKPNQVLQQPDNRASVKSFGKSGEELDNKKRQKRSDRNSQPEFSLQYYRQLPTREEILSAARLKVSEFNEVLKRQRSYYAYDSDPNHSQTAIPLVIALRDLAEVYGELENYKKQKELLEEALEINRKGDNPIETAKTLHKLGNANYNLKDFQKAKEYYQEVLDIAKSSRQIPDLEVVDMFNNLGSVYHALGDYQEAKEKFEQVLQIVKKLSVSSDIKVGIALHNLGKVHRDLKDHQKAEKFFEESLPIYKKAYGSDDIAVGRTLDELGNTCYYLEKWQKAKDLHERALPIYEKFYGSNNVEVAELLDSIGEDYSALKEPHEAKKIYEKVLVIYKKDLVIKERHYGSNSVEVAETLRNLGNAYYDLDDFQKAKESYEKELKIRERYYSADDVKIAKTLHNLGNTYHALEDYQKAKEVFKSALAIEEKYPDKSIAAKTLEELKGTIRVLIETLQKALEAKERNYPTGHLQIGQTLKELADAYGELKDYPNQKEFLERALPILKEQLGSINPTIARMLKDLGNANAALGSTQKAQQLNKDASVVESKYEQVALEVQNRNKPKGALAPNLLHIYAKNGNLDEVKRLVEEGADINEKDGLGDTPLHLAAQGDKPDIIKYLASRRGIELDAVNKEGKTPMYLAISARFGGLKALVSLVEQGANVNVVNNKGYTPLSKAAANECWDKALVLLRNKANVNDLDPVQKQKLSSYAQRNGYTDIVTMLASSDSKTDPEPKSDPKSKSDPKPHHKRSSSKCLLSRRKREIDNCRFSWEDIDEFNEEKEESRDFSKIKINSDKFIDYIRSESMSEDKLAQLIQLADEVQVKGEFQGLVNKLISNQKVISHLNRVGRVSSIAMHGMIGKATLAAFLNGDYQGVAINLGFIAGGQGFAKVAEAVSIKGTGLVADGRLLLGRSLKAASPFLARGTSAFVAYDLVNQIKEYKKGNNDALVDIIGDSIYLGVDSAEIGIEVAEAFAVFEGVSSVTGPIGAAIGAVIFVGTDVYLAVKRVDKIDEIVHLTTKEKFIEGLRAFIGIGLESYVEELMEEKEVNNQLVTQGLEYLKQHDNIQRYVFPTGKSVIDSCRTVQYREQCLPTGLNVCYEDGSGNLFAIKKREKCTTKLQTDLDNKVLLDNKRTDIKWSRARPNDSGPGEFLCLPQGSDESVPSNGTYLCENAIGIEYTNNRTESNTLISLGNGDDVVIGFPQDNHIVVLGDGHKNITLGDGNDTFLLEGNNITGAIYGGNGTNTLDLEHFAQNERSVHVGLSKALGHLYYESADEISGVLGIHEINDVLLRKDKQDKVYTACDTRYVDGRGGRGNNSTDSIIIPYNGNCSYEMKLIVRPYTEIKNYAINGNFTYIVPIAGKGKASVNLIARTSPQSDHRFTFNHTLYDINNIEKINNTVNFSFMQNVGNLRFAQNPINSKHTGDYEFSITNDAPNNALYELNDNTEIKVGERNIYAIQSTNKSVDEIINDYPAIANNLKMSIFVQSLANNETVAVGHGNHDVLHNDPYYKSHLVGNGGENIFVVTSGYEVLDNNDLPIPEVVIYDLDKENLIDTLDLRQMKQQIVKDLGKEVKAKTLINNKDLLIELLCFRENQVEESVVRVRLKDALLTNWYERLHVIVGNVPMKIEEFELKPLPLIFDQSDKNIIVIGSQDIEEENKVVVSKEIGNYTFARSGNNLIITNAFDRNLTSNEFCTISLKGFYQETKMQTLDIKFADKEITLKDHQKQISTARDIDIVQKEYKDQVYNDVFNYTRSENTNSKVNETIINEKSRHERQNATVHQRSRRAINKKEILITSKVSENNKDPIFFVAQNNATFVMENDRASSAATRIGSGINDLFDWVKSSIGGLFHSRSIESEKTSNSTANGLPRISQVDAQVDVNGTITLLDLLVRKITGKKHIHSVDQPISLLEAQGYALNITTKFEQALNETAFKSGISATNLNFNPVAVQSTIVEKIISGKFSEIPTTLYLSAKEACPEFKQTDKFLANLKENLEKISAEKEAVFLLNKQKVSSHSKSLGQLTSRIPEKVTAAELSEKDNKPDTLLNGTSIAKGIGNVLEL